MRAFTFTFGATLLVSTSLFPVLAGPAVVAAAATRIPLVKGLALIGAASERQGDYEASTTVDSIEADGSLHPNTTLAGRARNRRVELSRP